MTPSIKQPLAAPFVEPSRTTISPSSIARIAGNILSGFAACGYLYQKKLTPGDMAHNNLIADEALRLARYMASKVEEGK